MQSTPLQDGSSTDEETNSYLIHCFDLAPFHTHLDDPLLPAFTEAEGRYIDFFISGLPVILGIHRMFPRFLGYIFARAIWTDALRSMVLAVSSYFVDNKLQKPPYHSYKYLQQAMPLIQDAITHEIVDDALIYSVFLAAYLHQICGELASSHRHLEGLHLLLGRYDVLSVHTKKAADETPVLKLVWRLAIQLDHMSAIGDEKLVFSLDQEDDDNNRREWISRLVDAARPEMVDWALAQFALDDMLTKAILVMSRASQLRSLMNGDSRKTETAIECEATKLLDDHSLWFERSCINAAKEQYLMEESDFGHELSAIEGSNSEMSLVLAPQQTINKGFGALMIQYYWVLMYITFISDSRPGVGPPKRYQAAVNLCRIYEATGCKDTFGIGRMVLGLYLTGLTFNESSFPAGAPYLSLISYIEFAWIGEKLLAIDEFCGYRAGSTVLNILRTTWRSEGSPWKHYIAGHNR